jgi:hypothetical protein
LQCLPKDRQEQDSQQGTLPSKVRCSTISVSSWHSLEQEAYLSFAAALFKCKQESCSRHFLSCWFSNGKFEMGEHNRSQLIFDNFIALAVVGKYRRFQKVIL